jgi:hypothetical protein
MSKKHAERERETIQAEPVDDPTSPNPGNRVRAATLRARQRAGGFLAPEDAAWLADYEEARSRTRDKRDDSLGASRARKVSYTEEEQEAVGSGSSAVAEVAAAGAMVREEGRRYDSLISVGITALRTACDMQSKMVEALLERNRDLESAHVSMMQASGKQYIRSVEAEAELVKIKQEMGGDEKKDAIAEMAEQLLPFILAKMGGPAGG